MSTTEKTTELDMLVIGAGFTGMYMLYNARDKLGLNAKAIDSAESVGGTWYWNRYPGARCDSPSHIYCYSFDKQLIDEWEWTEKYPEQKEILGYLENFSQRYNLEDNIDFGQFVNSCRYDESTNRWTVTTDKGRVYNAKYVVSGTGCLTAKNMPNIKGIESFKGQMVHTSRWPEHGIDFTTKRVAVIGTGATAVQCIPLISLQAKQLTVFQRTPVYCVPARNGKVDYTRIKEQKEQHESLRQRVQQSFFGFDYHFLSKLFEESTYEERHAEYERIYELGGLEYWLGNYSELFFSEEANLEISDFLRDKIRSIVHSPEMAQKLVPKYSFGTKRNPLDTNYYETFNKNHVHLVDASTDGPIEEITETGIVAGGKHYEFDIIVCATGFDAMTGALKNMNIEGRAGKKLNDLWRDGPSTYLGLMVNGFPNFFTVTGPQSPSAFSNVPVSIEQHVEFIRDCIQHMQETGAEKIEPTEEAQENWGKHLEELINATIIPKTDSWYTGSNVEGKSRKFLIYLGAEGVGGYRRTCDDVVRNGYEGFELSVH